MSATELYLDLLKKVLTNTLHREEPSIDASAPAFLMGFLDHYINGPATTMLPLSRMDNILTCAKDVIARNVPGDFIETGVWRGGATIFMRAILKAFDIDDRVVWVADSFEGLPEPDGERFPIEAKAHHGSVMTHGYKQFAASLEEVQANFRSFGLLDGQVRMLKGWFKDTLPNAPIERLAIMRLDGDYYESTMDALINLYDKLSVGGYVIIDDYGEDTWTYCRQAVDDFRSSRNVTDQIVDVDSRCSYWRRSV